MSSIARLSAACVTVAIVSGCAQAPRHPPAAQSQTQSVGHAALAVYREAASKPAAALVFSPPMVQDAPPLELSRDLRRPGAFVGYPESVVEFFYVRWDDSQVGGDGSTWSGSGHGGSSGFHDRYERRAISEKTGVLYR